MAQHACLGSKRAVVMANGRRVLLTSKTKLPYDAEVEWIQNTGAQAIQIPSSIAGYCSSIHAIIGIHNTSARNFLLAYGTGNCQYFEYYNKFQIEFSGSVTTNAEDVNDITLKDDGTTSVNGHANSISTNNVKSFFFNMPGHDLFIGHYSQYSSFSTIYSIAGSNFDFIPVRFTNELGVSEGAMYDKVSRQLFRNQGTGAFIIGPDKKTAKDYVQDGLVAMVDGEWNAGFDTHVESGPVIELFSGNVFSSFVSVGQRAVKEAGDANLQLGRDVTDIFSDVSNEVTVELLVDVADNAVFSANHSLLQTPSASAINVQCRGGYLQVWPIRNLFGPGNTMLLQPTALDGFLRCSYSVNVSGDLASVYSGGAFAASRTVSREVSSPSQLMSNIPAGSKLYCIRIYNRALTAEEIAHNFAIDKARFSLPS